jgi:hypothetical protein
MEVAVLKKMNEGVFRPKKLETSSEIKSVNFKDIILCSKSCDGTYHRVNSDVAEILSENKTSLSNGGFQKVINQFFDEDTHGQRFIVYPNKDKAFLIGNLFFGLKKLSKLQ